MKKNACLKTQRKGFYTDGNESRKEKQNMEIWAEHAGILSKKYKAQIRLKLPKDTKDNKMNIHLQ